MERLKQSVAEGFTQLLVYLHCLIIVVVVGGGGAVVVAADSFREKCNK